MMSNQPLKCLPYSIALWPLSLFTALLHCKHHNHHHFVLFYSCLSWAAFLQPSYMICRFEKKKKEYLLVFRYIVYLEIFVILVTAIRTPLCHHDHHHHRRHHYHHHHHHHHNHIHLYVNLVDNCQYNSSNKKVILSDPEGSQVQWEFIFSLH